jgi:arylsulfatase
MNNYTERTWVMIPIEQAVTNLMKTYVDHPPRKLQSLGYDGPLTLSTFQRNQAVREMLQKEGISFPKFTGN